MTTLYRLEEIFHHVRTNEEILRKFFEMEMEILTVATFRDLFERLLTLVEEKFSIPHVWISLIEEETAHFPWETLKASHLLKERLNVLSRKSFSSLVDQKGLPKLVNENLKSYYRLLPHQRKCMVKSMAVCPLFFRDETIGSLNLGDYSESRFQPDMDTFFLSQLSLIVSISLSNVLTQENLRKRVTRDDLTGLPNGLEMKEFLDRQVVSSRSRGFPLSVVAFCHEDYDNVKETQGREKSDACAVLLAGVIGESRGGEDSLFRSRENGYVLCLPYREASQARELARRVSAGMASRPLEGGGPPLPIVLRIGVASTEEAGIHDGDSLIERAFARLDDLSPEFRDSAAVPVPQPPGTGEGRAP